VNAHRAYAAPPPVVLPYLLRRLLTYRHSSASSPAHARSCSSFAFSPTFFAIARGVEQPGNVLHRRDRVLRAHVVAQFEF
jgi:hypothetical protein